MNPMEPVNLSGELVAIEPLSTEHASGLLVAADTEEVFAWLPYPQPADLEEARAWIADALADRDRWGNKWGNMPHRLQPISIRRKPL